MGDTLSMIHFDKIPLHLWTLKLEDKLCASKIQWWVRHWIVVTEIPVQKGEN